MRRLVVLIGLLLMTGVALHAERRFGRPVIKLQNPEAYTFIHLDGVKIPVLSEGQYTVTCLVYRGTEYYYVEIGIQNRSSSPVTLSSGFLSFSKPGYSVFGADNRLVASELAHAAGERFIPTPSPRMPERTTTVTTYNANATSYGNTTSVDGTATSTTYDSSGQAGANLGNAIGNAIAARRFYRLQRDDIALVQYLTNFGWSGAPEVVAPGKLKVVMMIFDQIKRKKAKFSVTVHVADKTFVFHYKG